MPAANSVGATAPGSVTPTTSDEAPSWQAAGLQEEREATDSHDSAVSDAYRKRFADLQARLALAGGFQLHNTVDGKYLVSRWNLSRGLSNLDEVAAFLDRVGVRHA